MVKSSSNSGGGGRVGFDAPFTKMNDFNPFPPEYWSQTFTAVSVGGRRLVPQGIGLGFTELFSATTNLILGEL